MTYDITKLFGTGRTAIAVVLGGWFDSPANAESHFHGCPHEK